MLTSKKNVSRSQTARSKSGRAGMPRADHGGEEGQCRRGTAEMGGSDRMASPANTQLNSFPLESIAAAVIADIARPRLEIRIHILIFRIIVGANSNSQTFDP